MKTHLWVMRIEVGWVIYACARHSGWSRKMLGWYLWCLAGSIRQYCLQIHFGKLWVCFLHPFCMSVTLCVSFSLSLLHLTPAIWQWCVCRGNNSAFWWYCWTPVRGVLISHLTSSLCNPPPRNPKVPLDHLGICNPSSMFWVCLEVFSQLVRIRAPP